MPKIAWAKQAFNAYNSIKKNQKVYLIDGTYIGTANGWTARCTSTKPGSIQLDSGEWISGNVEKKNNCWFMTKTASVYSSSR